MKYLFYDLEFASCKGGHKVCEFGYMVTDESFNPLEEGNLVMNPRIASDSDWDGYALDKILTRKKEEYKREKVFSYYYPTIKAYFDEADKVFGHTNSGDAEALNEECLRYNLPPINHEFYDIKEFYKIYSNTTNATSLENIVKNFGIDGDGNLHDAQSDAYNTMVSLKIMLQKMNLTLDELILKCPNVYDKSIDYKVWSIEETKRLKEEKRERERCGDGTNDIINGSLNRKRVSQFMSHVKETEKVSDKLDGKKISLSECYELHHYKQVLNLIQLIKNNGGIVINKTQDANLFIRYDELNENGEIMISTKIPYLQENVEIIELSDLLTILGLTEEELDNLPLIPFDFVDEIYQNKHRQHKRKDKKIDNSPLEEPEKLTSSLEDLFDSYMKKYKKK